MTIEINPVLAGTYQAPDYVPKPNFASREVEAVTDSRRYTQFDRTATHAGEATDFDFGDFLDMINPLQHIPGVSAIYRAVTGEEIHPVSRVTGDLMYGAAMGGATLMISAIGAIADTLIQTQTGQSIGGNAVSWLFGPDGEEPATQLAEADKPEAALAALAPLPPDVTPREETKTLVAAAEPVTAAPSASTSPAVPPAQELPADNKNIPPEIHALAATKAYPLPPRKLPYGGVMEGNLTQQQAMAMALATGAPSLRMGDKIYTGRLMAGARSSSPAAVSPQPQPPPSGNPLPPELVQDLMMMKAIKNYKNMADQGAPAGSNLDVVN